MKKVLIVIEKFLPDSSAIINCLHPIILGMKEKNISIDVLTYRKEKKLSNFETINGVNIYRVNDIYNLSDNKLLKKTILRIYRKLFLDRKFIKLGKSLLNKNKYDCLIACSYPFLMEYCASKIAHNTNIPFVSYQFDPYSNNKIIAKPSQEKRTKEEIKVLSKAAKVFLPIEYYDENMDSELSILKNKYHPIDFPLISEVNGIENNRLSDLPTFAYAGAFYDDVREPKQMLEFFSKLDMDFRLYIYCIARGKCRKQLEEYKEILKEKLVLKYDVCKEECNNIIYNADFNINLGNNISNQVPSKLYEIVSIGKPIINFYTIEEDTSKKFLERYELCLNLNIQKDSDSNINTFENFYQKNINKKLSYKDITSIYKDSKQIVNEFISEVEKVCENK